MIGWAEPPAGGVLMELSPAARVTLLEARGWFLAFACFVAWQHGVTWLELAEVHHGLSFRTPAARSVCHLCLFDDL